MKHLLLGILVVAQMASAQVERWVDENGQVHYGDSVPEKYRKKAEEVELKPLPVVGQEDEVAQKNKQYTNKLKKEDAQKKADERRREAEAIENSVPQTQGPMTREQCRDTYGARNTAQKTQCFQEAEKYYQDLGKDSQKK